MDSSNLAGSSDENQLLEHPCIDDEIISLVAQWQLEADFPASRSPGAIDSTEKGDIAVVDEVPPIGLDSTEFPAAEALLHSDQSNLLPQSAPEDVLTDPFDINLFLLLNAQSEQACDGQEAIGQVSDLPAAHPDSNLDPVPEFLADPALGVVPSALVDPAPTQGSPLEQPVEPFVHDLALDFESTIPNHDTPLLQDPFHVLNTPFTTADPQSLAAGPEIAPVAWPDLATVPLKLFPLDSHPHDVFLQQSQVVPPVIPEAPLLTDGLSEEPLQSDLIVPDASFDLQGLLLTDDISGLAEFPEENPSDPVDPQLLGLDAFGVTDEQNLEFHAPWSLPADQFPVFSPASDLLPFDFPPDRPSKPASPAALPAVAVAEPTRRRQHITRRVISPPSETPSKQLSPGYRPQPRQNQPWVKVNASTLGKNKRSAKIDSFNPRAIYDELDAAPEPWGPFEYSADGELMPGDTFTALQIREYLFNHPLHSHNGKTDRKRSRLRLWIQRAPADSARRKPTAVSDRCRYDKCPCRNGSIRVGHFRVCFDEQSWKNHAEQRCTDPLINAGYVHLFCLEKLIDFPLVVRDLNVRPDARRLRHELDGINRMDLGHEAVLAEAEAFVDACAALGDGDDDGDGDGADVDVDAETTALAGYPRITADYGGRGGVRPYEGTLNHRLQMKKIQKEQPCRQRRREALGDRGSQIHHHLGDLEAEQREKEKVLAERKLDRLMNKRRRGSAAPRGNEVDVDDNDDDDDDYANGSVTTTVRGSETSGVLTRAKRRKTGPTSHDVSDGGSG